MNAPAAAIPNARRTVVRWLGVIGLHRSGLTRARARRASHGGVAARAAGSSDGSGMAEEVNAAGPLVELPTSYPCPCHATKMKCPERIVVRECRVGAEMLTAVHSDNASEYRPLLKQLLLAQPEHRVHAAGQAPHGLGRVSDRQQRGAGHADARRAASGDPGNLHVHDIGLTMTTDPPT